MKGQKTLFSKAKNDWETPQKFFDLLHEEYRFTFDAAAGPGNFKCLDWSGDSLCGAWPEDARVWINPPYDLTKEFVAKAVEQITLWQVELVVMLIPARTDTKVWHEVIVPSASEVIFLKGRLKFGGGANCAPFPSALVVFRRGGEGPPKVRWEDWRG